MDIIIRQADVYTPEHIGCADIAIKDGKIVKIAASIEEKAEKEINAAGLTAVPGAIETHGHMLLPFAGTQTMNNFYDGTRSGAYGGVTSLVDFADQIHGETVYDILERRLELAKISTTDYTFSLTLTDITDETLASIPDLIEKGYKSFKFYTTYTPGGLRAPYDRMEKAFEIIAAHGGIATVHAESEEINNEAEEALIREGKTGYPYFIESKPAISEIEAIKRLIELQKKTGVHLLTRHLSTGKGARMIYEAQKEGREVYGEMCPHYLYFDESVYYKENGGDYIVHPRIKTAEDREGLWKVLESDAKLTIGTDDCSFYLKQKRVSDRFDGVPGGMPGIETRFSVLYTLGVAGGRISTERFANVISTYPAKLYGLYPEKGAIAVGSDADLVLFDSNAEFVIRAEDLHEKSDYTPFEGFAAKGAVKYTFSRGVALVEDGKENMKEGRGHRMIMKSSESIL